MLEQLLSPALAAFLKDNGLAGLVIVSMAWLCRSQFLMICSLHEKRIEDQKEIAHILEKSTEAKIANTAAIERLEIIFRAARS